MTSRATASFSKNGPVKKSKVPEDHVAAEPEHGWHGYSAKVQAMAKRLKEGRTFQRQLLLTSAGLCQPVSDAAREEMLPVPGLSAQMADEVVLILHTFLRRGRRLCHIAVLEERRGGPGDASHVVSQNPVEEVGQRLEFKFTNLHALQSIFLKISIGGVNL